MDGEKDLIARIRRALPARRVPGLVLGIGDDAAVLRPNRAVDWVISCDAFLEGVHFLAATHPPETVGYRALARASSDLAAMGAYPRFFLLTLALPPGRVGRWLDRFLHGLARAAKRFGLVLVGGDTSRQPRVVISITVLGEVPAGRALRRAGARPGDLLYVSGRLGAAALGLELLRRGLGRRRRFRRLLRPHLDPPIRLALGQWLARRRLASAMIDTSDGLSTDLTHLVEAGGVGARLERSRLPLAAVPRELVALGIDPLELAINGGEDYELLFTVPRRLRPAIPRSYRGVPLTCIGEIIPEKKLLLGDSAGRARILRAGGWDPFRSRP
jgi:thiamine-monophosphate kinase